jgi:hypothetical protein
MQEASCIVPPRCSIIVATDFREEATMAKKRARRSGVVRRIHLRRHERAALLGCLTLIKRLTGLLIEMSGPARKGARA